MRILLWKLSHQPQRHWELHPHQEKSGTEKYHQEWQNKTYNAYPAYKEKEKPAKKNFRPETIRDREKIIDILCHCYIDIYAIVIFLEGTKILKL